MEIFGKLIKIVFILVMATGSSFASGPVYNFDYQDNDTAETIVKLGFISPAKLEFTREALETLSDPKFNPSKGKDSETRAAKALLFGVVQSEKARGDRSLPKVLNEWFTVSDSPIEVNIEAIGYNLSMHPRPSQITEANALFHKAINYSTCSDTERGTLSFTWPMEVSYFDPDATLLYSFETQSIDFIKILKDEARAYNHTVTYPAVGKIRIQHTEVSSAVALVDEADYENLQSIEIIIVSPAHGTSISLYPIRPTANPAAAIRDMLAKNYTIDYTQPTKIRLRGPQDSAASSKDAVENLSVSGKDAVPYYDDVE